MAKKFHSKHTRNPACILIGSIRNPWFLSRNRSGLSTIVVTVILVALSMAAVVLVWAFVNNLIKKQISSSESCFGNAEKITLNERYTCYEQISASNFKLRFSLAVGDIKVNKVIVSVSSAGSVKSYEIMNSTTIPNLVMYSGANPATIILPGENSGLTYNATGFTSKIDSIQIIPVLGGTTCEVSDSLSEIENCVLLA